MVGDVVAVVVVRYGRWWTRWWGIQGSFGYCDGKVVSNAAVVAVVIGREMLVVAVWDIVVVETVGTLETIVLVEEAAEGLVLVMEGAAEVLVLFILRGG